MVSFVSGLVLREFLPIPWDSSWALHISFDLTNEVVLSPVSETDLCTRAKNAFQLTSKYRSTPHSNTLGRMAAAILLPLFMDRG